MTIDSVIFRSSDIRGLYPSEIDTNVMHIIGQAFGAYVRAQGGVRVYIAHDNRPSSPALAEAFATGLASTGCQALEIGMAPTPVLYFASTTDEGSYGAMITASHLPAASNGVKFCRGNWTLYREINGRIRELALGRVFPAGKGSRAPVEDVFQRYQSEVLKIRLDRPLKVVVDCQNGAASPMAPALVQKLGAQVECVHCDSTAPYPGDRPDPQITRNLEQLIARVKETHADAGIALDGDADRVGVVDDLGRHVAIDRLLAVLVGEILARNPGGRVIYDVLCSQVLVDAITRAGGTAIGSKSGHAFVKDLLHSEDALLGGELSGHIFYADRYLGYDDGIYAACRLLELLGRSPKPLSALLDELPVMYSSPETRPHCPEALKNPIIRDVEAAFRQAGYPILTLDGVRVNFAHGWGIVRASGTEPVLSMRVEAETDADLQTYTGLVKETLAAAGRKHGVEFEVNA